MNQSQYNQLFSFIWNIATDVLVYAFEKGEYKKIIMPMMVLRRIDVLLEPTKQQLLTQKEVLDMIFILRFILFLLQEKILLFLLELDVRWKMVGDCFYILRVD